MRKKTGRIISLLYVRIYCYIEKKAATLFKDLTLNLEVLNEQNPTGYSCRGHRHQALAAVKRTLS
jgi:hypothetical protein